MIKFCYLLIILFFAVSNANFVLAADVIIIKSNDISPYNEAIAGFREEIKGDVIEYDLRGEAGNVSQIIAKIMASPPKLIFALGALAAVKIGENINFLPILYTLVFDPVDKGLTRRQNMTGILIEADYERQFSILKKIAPNIKRIGILYSYLNESSILEAQKYSAPMGVELLAVKLRQPEDVPAGANQLIVKADALWLIPDSNIINQSSLNYLLSATLKYKLPFMVYSANFVKAGALLSPVINNTDIGRQAGKLGQQVLLGKALPGGTLSPAEVKWAINLSTAKSIGLQIPENVLTEFEHIYK